MDVFVNVASWALLVGGAIFCIIGAVGVLRFPDLYTRTHAATITDTLGAGMLLVGLTLQAGPNLTAVKLLMVLAFLLYTSPVSGHALVKAAYAHGLKAELDVPMAARVVTAQAPGHTGADPKASTSVPPGGTDDSPQGAQEGGDGIPG